MTQEMIQDITQSLEACASHYGQDANAVRDYLIQGQKRALALPNRGPIRFDKNGDIHPDILTTYAKYGFYVFENVLGEEELADIHADLEMLRDNFPTHMGAATDAHCGTTFLPIWAQQQMHRVARRWVQTVKQWPCSGQNHCRTH